MTEYEENNMNFCSQCGAYAEPSAKFCSRCGHPFAAKSQDRSRTSGYSDAGGKAKRSFENGFNSLLYFIEQSDYIPYESEENRFIGTNVEYYRDKFNEMRMLNQKITLNWAALLFGVFWMLYRKMYGVAAAAIVATILVGCLGAAGGALGLVLTVCYGLFGNYLYMMTVQKRVTELQRFAEPARSQYIEKYAGVSGTAVLIGIVVVALSTIPFWMLMGLSFLSFLAF